jgi:hypothetical protein
MNSEKSKPVTTTKPAGQGAGKHGKAVEAPVHHPSSQRRTVASDEEKKEREAKAAHGRKHGGHGGHGAHGGHEGHEGHGL